MWLLFGVTGNFVYYRGYLDWDAARASCVSKGGDLAAVGSASENVEAMSKITGVKNTWMGYRCNSNGRCNQRDQWSWANGASPTTYQNWDRRGEPNGPTEACGYFKRSGVWGNLRCTGQARWIDGYLCSMPPQPTQPTSSSGFRCVKGSFCRQVVETYIFSRAALTASCAADPACLAYDYQLKTGGLDVDDFGRGRICTHTVAESPGESCRGRFSCRNDFVVCEKVSPPPPPPPPPSPNLLPAACSCPSTSSQKYTLVKRGAKCPFAGPTRLGMTSRSSVEACANSCASNPACTHFSFSNVNTGRSANMCMLCSSSDNDASPEYDFYHMAEEPMMPQGPHLTCRAVGDPHYRNFYNARYDFYGRGLFEQARFTVPNCGCEVVVQVFLVKLISGWPSNSAIGATAVRAGSTVITITDSGVVDVTVSGRAEAQLTPRSAVSSHIYGGCAIKRERLGRGWVWKVVFPGASGSYVVCMCTAVTL